MIAFEIFFWTVFLTIVLHYFLFGLAVKFITIFYKKSHVTSPGQPNVTFIVAAYNEEKIIAKKILSDLGTQYPWNKIQYIVACDGSTDSTVEIAKGFSHQGVAVLHQSGRQGKAAALNRAMVEAKNEIVIFSDANSFFRPDAISCLVRHFVDKDVGGVCGRKCILPSLERKASLGDRLYWRYESQLKEAESNLGSIPTADGEIFALRRSLFKPIPPHLINDDLFMTLSLVQQKRRVIFDREAIAEEDASQSHGDDFNVKSRMVYGGLQSIMYFASLLNPLKSWFGLQFFIHKTMRYLMWVLLILLFGLNILCFKLHIFYQMFLVSQALFYFMALWGFQRNRRGRHLGFLYLPFYYCNVNVAALRGFLFFLNQRSLIEIWRKAER